MEDIKKIMVGATIEPDMTKFRDRLVKKCNDVGLNFDEIENECKKELPQKRTYSEIIEDTQVDGIEQGLHLAFETLLTGENLNTRKLGYPDEKEPYSTGFSQEHRYKCRMDILRALCISLKDSTLGYEQESTINLNKFLSEKGINHKLQITKEQLDYIHSLNLDNVEEFIENIDLTLLPQKLYESTDIWRALDKKGDENDYLYEKKEKNAYRIYMNFSGKSDKADIFLTDYIKMCISRKIPFSMKGHQGKENNSKDNTVLYLTEENLMDYLQVLDDLSAIHPDIIANFGEPPVLTQKLRSKVQNIPSGWFGFADLGNDGCATYNDRTEKSCVNAFIATIYSNLSYKSKSELQNKGYSTKALDNIARFKTSYGREKGKYKKVVFLEEVEYTNLKSPLTKSGELQGYNREIAKDILSICKNELERIMQNPEKKQRMFNEFKSYYVLMENYFKYNHSKLSSEFSFEDYKKLPTTVSISLYEKYKEELLNRESKQEKVKKEKSFSQAYKEAMEEFYGDGKQTGVKNEKNFFQVYQQGLKELGIQEKKFTEQEIGKATINRETTQKDKAQSQEKQDEQEIYKAKEDESQLD